MNYSSVDIFVAFITIFLIVAINYFRNGVFRYYLIFIYLAFAIYIYNTIDKRYSFGILIIFIFNYMFIAKAPILETFIPEEEEPLENPQLIGVEEDVETQDEEDVEEELVEKKLENEDEEENGIEQFKTEDKFTKLHEILHTMSEQIKKAEK